MINQTMNMMQMNIQVRLKYIKVLKNIVIIYYQDKNRNQPYSAGILFIAFFVLVRNTISLFISLYIIRFSLSRYRVSRHTWI